jgi:hypothetical protein
MSSAFIAGCGEAMSASVGAKRLATPAEVEINYITYRCESGRSVRAAYPEGEHALLDYAGKTSDMFAKTSDSGVRYVGDGLEWHVQGMGSNAQGVLTRDTNGYVLETCQHVQIIAKNETTRTAP